MTLGHPLLVALPQVEAFPVSTSVNDADDPASFLTKQACCHRAPPLDLPVEELSRREDPHDDRTNHDGIDRL